MRRVVITGCGSINALGSNLEETWESLAEGKDGISELDIQDKERLSSRIGGQVDLSKIKNNNLHPKNYSHLDKSTLFAILASRQAIQSSGIDFQKYEYSV